MSEHLSKRCQLTRAVPPMDSKTLLNIAKEMNPGSYFCVIFQRDMKNGKANILLPATVPAVVKVFSPNDLTKIPDLRSGDLRSAKSAFDVLTWKKGSSKTISISVNCSVIVPEWPDVKIDLDPRREKVLEFFFEIAEKKSLKVIFTDGHLVRDLLICNPILDKRMGMMVGKRYMSN